MKRILLLLASLSIAVLELIACGNGAAEVPLEDTWWVLESYGKPGNLHMLLKDTEITLQFISTEAKIRGSAGCNQYSGGYEVNKDKLIIKPPIGSTMMACPPAVMRQEKNYLSILEAADSYQIKGGKLQISSGNKVLILNRK